MFQSNVRRRKLVLAHREQQLLSGVKPVKKSNETVPLTEADINRINSEIAVLKTRIY